MKIMQCYAPPRMVESNSNPHLQVFQATFLERKSACVPFCELGGQAGTVIAELDSEQLMNWVEKA